MVLPGRTSYGRMSLIRENRGGMRKLLLEGQSFAAFALVDWPNEGSELPVQSLNRSHDSF